MTDTLPRAPSFRLDGRRALVTGAGSGIGAAAAAALADSGAHVTLVARGRESIDAVAAEIAKRGGKAEAHAIDVTDTAAVRAMVERSEPFHIVVNNAGTNRPKPFGDVSEDDYDAVMDLNVRAAFFVAQAVTARMVATGTKGSIVNISSQMGHVGAPNRTIYCCSKWAIEGLTKAMAMDLAPHGIRVNTLGPTFIETPMTRPFFENAEFRDAVLAKIKLGRIGQVEDLTGGLIYLASDASSLVTGTSLIIDGGWTAD
ncbi:MAG TPA: glucose 1-dehydrogenase [Pseudolabrys sp.]|nr:glucose 1-dehydrogenase [Pseudolabrys sp.]